MNTKKLIPAKYSLATEFGLNIDPTIMFSGYDRSHPAAPPIKDGYVFQRGKLRELLAFWQVGFTALKIMGDPATGKTSLIEQWHARLGWPLHKVACSGTTEKRDLIGHLVPTEAGTLRWVDGPVLLAAKEGTSVLLDEYNALDPNEATGLNMLLEGYTITVEETGEVVTPQPGFRVFATENAVQSRLSVAGRNIQDVANDDRWMIIQAQYLPEDLEIKVVYNAMIAAKIPHDKADMEARLIVQLANQVRQAYNNKQPSIEKPMSTRTAIRWALLTSRFGGVSGAEGGPMIYALHRSFAMSQAMAATVNEYAKAKLGIQ
jgi:cobaltochelatase CobS